MSHGHAALVQRLLDGLAHWDEGAVARVVVTHNLPEAAIAAPADGWPFEVVTLDNAAPLGFGANHNQAFAHCAGELFCVLNPDVEWTGPGVWAGLLAAQDSRPGIGCTYPVLLNADGSVQENEREAVTPAALFRRYALRRRQQRVDWVSAAFWLVPAAAYRALDGFDERYFMYCEDTDFCLRLRLAGYALQRAGVRLVHPAHRASRRDAGHLAWHVRSLLRLWTGTPLRRYLGLPT